MMRDINWICVGFNLTIGFYWMGCGRYGLGFIHVSLAAVIAFCQIMSELSPAKEPHEPPKTNAYLVTDNPYQAPQQS